MSCLGVHFALKKSEVEKLMSMDNEQDRREFVTEIIEEKYLLGEKKFAAECDKAWDAMHRALADGELTWHGGNYPLNHAVLGGELLYVDDDYIMSLKIPHHVIDIDRALNAISKDEFKQKYFTIDANSYSFELTDEDLDSTWDRFQKVRQFYSRAAAEDRYVLFAANTDH